jgi:ABC-2 type transport system ATP-binding protein
MVRVEDVTFGYSRTALFSHLSLALEPGNTYGLLGRNGAGKTSLLKLLSGVRYAREGRISVLGMDPRLRPAHLLEDIFMLPEELFIPPLRPPAYERLYAPLYPRFDHGLFRGLLSDLEIDPARKLTEVSFGQKRKFLLAFGLACRARLLLLDEPTNGLDIPAKSQLRRVLAEQKAGDRVIVVSTHQVRDMEGLIDPIIILDQGRVIFQQPLAEAARRLSMRLEVEEPSGGALHSEKTVGGWLVVRTSQGEEGGRIDLETLFNAVVGNPAAMAAVFQLAPAPAAEDHP